MIIFNGYSALAALVALPLAFFLEQYTTVTGDAAARLALLGIAVEDLVLRSWLRRGSLLGRFGHPDAGGTLFFVFPVWALSLALLPGAGRFGFDLPTWTYAVLLGAVLVAWGAAGWDSGAFDDPKDPQERELPPDPTGRSTVLHALVLLAAVGGIMAYAWENEAALAEAADPPAKTAAAGAPSKQPATVKAGQPAAKTDAAKSRRARQVDGMPGYWKYQNKKGSWVLVDSYEKIPKAHRPR